jgi:hypothetical protein
MNIKLGLLGILGFVGGCASTGAGPGRGEPDFSGVTRRSTPSVLVGDARVVDSKVNPLVPVQASTEGNEVTLRFGRPRHDRGVARLEASSFELVSVKEPTDDDDSRAPEQAARVLLDDGHFIVCWKRGNAESGYRALAQAYKQDGTPVGAPTVISPPNMDVVGMPQMVSTDGHHVIATFAAGSEGSFALLAVPIEDVSESDVAAATLALAQPAPASSSRR